MRPTHAPDYAYSARPVRNPFRYAAAVWRLIRDDPAESTADAAIVEIGFARSRFGRRFARWQETVDLLSSAPHMAGLFESRPRFGPIVLADLEDLPHGTLGRVFADHCRARGLDPNLIQISPEDAVGWLLNHLYQTDAVGWLLNHLYQTHDVWHVVTGWGNDLAGEVGLGGFYAAQLRSPAFFGYMLALIFFNVISRRADLDEVFAALSAGYRAGRAAEPLFGADWDALFPLPVDEVRQRFAIDRSEVVGEGIRQAA
jgi:ubiquinone biosynthesis protein Coq4